MMVNHLKWLTCRCPSISLFYHPSSLPESRPMPCRLPRPSHKLQPAFQYSTLLNTYLYIVGLIELQPSYRWRQPPRNVISANSIKCCRPPPPQRHSRNTLPSSHRSLDEWTWWQSSPINQDDNNDVLEIRRAFRSIWHPRITYSHISNSNAQLGVEFISQEGYVHHSM